LNDLEYQLREWGSFHIAHVDFADEFGENILYNAGILQGRVQFQAETSKVLCPDAPRRIQRVQIAVNRLEEPDRGVLVSWYCAPVREDGAPYTRREMAAAMSLTKPDFDGILRKARKTVRKYLPSR